jgi:hypothetical protein
MGWWEGKLAVPSEAADLRELEMLGEVLDLFSGQSSGEASDQFEGQRTERVGEMLAGRSAAVFLAEGLLKVRGKDGKLHALKPNAVQREFERRRGPRNIVLKARQMGMTTWVAGRFLLKTITQPGTLTLQVAHTQEAAEEILRIVHRFVEHLPAGLRYGALTTSRSSVRQIVFPKIDSEYRVESAADRNAGRGLTFQNLHCSEVARWDENAHEVLAGLRAGLAPEGEMVLESTPCGAEGCFYEQWTRAEEIGLTRHFFPWWLEPGYRAAPVEEASLTGEEMELMTRPGVALDLGQIGFRRGLQAGLLKLARQEYAEDAESCFLVSGEPYFELEAVERRMKTALEPVERTRNGRLAVWLPPMPGRWYVVAVDPAGGGAEGDCSAIEVLDLEMGVQCAEFAGHVGGLELMELARQVAWDYGTAWLVVERNNHGAEQLGLLAQKGYLRVYRGEDGKPGFLTTSVSRPAVLARMALALMETPEIFQSKALLAECRSFVRLRNGGVGARHGAYDDRVMAMAIGLAARAEILGRKRV